MFTPADEHFLKLNQRQGKPRSRDVTEIRGPYCTPVGKRYLQDILETIHEIVRFPPRRRCP